MNPPVHEWLSAGFYWTISCFFLLLVRTLNQTVLAAPFSATTTLVGVFEHHWPKESESSGAALGRVSLQLCMMQLDGFAGFTPPSFLYRTPLCATYLRVTSRILLQAFAESLHAATRDCQDKVLAGLAQCATLAASWRIQYFFDPGKATWWYTGTYAKSIHPFHLHSLA